VKPLASRAARLRPTWRGTGPFVATPTPNAVAPFGVDRVVATETDETAALASLMDEQSDACHASVPNVRIG